MVVLNSLKNQNLLHDKKVSPTQVQLNLFSTEQQQTHNSALPDERSDFAAQNR